jgi:hypothetical protein
MLQRAPTTRRGDRIRAFAGEGKAGADKGACQRHMLIEGSTLLTN